MQLTLVNHQQIKNNSELTQDRQVKIQREKGDRDHHIGNYGIYYGNIEPGYLKEQVCNYNAESDATNCCVI